MSNYRLHLPASSRNLRWFVWFTRLLYCADETTTTKTAYSQVWFKSVFEISGLFWYSNFFNNFSFRFTQQTKLHNWKTNLTVFSTVKDETTTNNLLQSGLVLICFRKFRFILVFKIFNNVYFRFTNRQKKTINQTKRRVYIRNQRTKFERSAAMEVVNRSEYIDRNRSRGRSRERKRGGGAGGEGCRRWNGGRWRVEVSRGYKLRIAIDPSICSLSSPPTYCSTPSLYLSDSILKVDRVRCSVSLFFFWV